MVINGMALLKKQPIKHMMVTKMTGNHVSHGLSEAGYDIRLKQDIMFHPIKNSITSLEPDEEIPRKTDGRFILGSAIEEFDMPDNLIGIVHDKSTWARKGLSVFNTVIESGWKGFLTLELVYHGRDTLYIPAGSGIAQVVFHETVEARNYSGKYQHQANEPTPAKFTENGVK